MGEAEYVYSYDQEFDNIDSSSEPVQGLATRVYNEFERMIAKYDQDSVRDLMPLVVTMLETLDRSIKERNQSLVEVELLEEDKKQLKSQYERERQLKRDAERRLMESEDTVENISQELKESKEKIDLVSRQMDIKTKSHRDQMERVQDRQADLKKEFMDLHQRHTEMIRSYVEHIEKTKSLQQMTPEYTVFSPIAPKRKPEIVDEFSCPTPESETDKSIVSTPLEDCVDSAEFTKPRRLELDGPVNVLNVAQEISAAVKIEDGAKIETGNGDAVSLESASSVATDSAQALCDEFQNNMLNLESPVETSTPHFAAENSPRIRRPSGLGVEKCGLENIGFEQGNNDSLFAEMSGKDLNDVDAGADLLGMGRELESLMLENTKLMATKNALDIVTDDLIHQVDRLTGQLTMLQEDLDRSHQAKDLLAKRHEQLEARLRELEREASERNDVSPASGASKTPDETIPKSQIKRFTRVEMARVLMERNQYKERLMELQEAVRWTEMLRASRDHPAEETVAPKPKSSFSQFFNRLFGPSSNNSNSNAHSLPLTRRPPNSYGAGNNTRANARQSPVYSRRQSGVSSTEEAKMRYSKSDSFTTV